LQKAIALFYAYGGFDALFKAAVDVEAVIPYSIRRAVNHGPCPWIVIPLSINVCGGCGEYSDSTRIWKVGMADDGLTDHDVMAWVSIGDFVLSKNEVTGIGEFIVNGAYGVDGLSGVVAGVSGGDLCGGFGAVFKKKSRVGSEGT
jgi:hypothetical protein